MGHPRWFRPDELLRLVIVSGVLEASSPIHIGSGRVSAFGEYETLKVLIQGEEVPYIPATSIRGMIRSYTERILRAQGFRVCGGFGRGSCSSKHIGEVRLSDIVQKLIVEGRGLEALDLLWKELCLACKLFGAYGYEPKIITYDSLPISYRLGHRAMIAIDRGTGALAPGSVRTIEYIQPGSKFRFRLDLINLPNYLIGLIALVIMDINAGFVRIGAFRSKGFGVLAIRDLSISIIHHSPDSGNEEVLKALDEFDEDVRIKGTSLSGSEAERLLRRCIQIWHRKVKDLAKVYGLEKEVHT